ncbi:MAG: threonine synthase [Acidobacteria bacterium]|nr:threonine synthase [Acidobacteriota bacterium]
MQYFSTNGRAAVVGFREALLMGQPEDGGLYFPSQIPDLSELSGSAWSPGSEAETVFRLMHPYVGGEIPDADLGAICGEAINFPFPLVEITPGVFVLELFHGPTLAFKDVGARFMSRCLGHFSHSIGKRAVVIVATSGDTGGAVAHGFAGVEGVSVVILYPKGRVSRVQELQLTRTASNVITMEVQGSFDDCQKLAKTALADPTLRHNYFLTSANSMNIARWLPQQTYYFTTIRQLAGKRVVFSVPSGNFGNIAAGLLAQSSGLEAKSFIAACNANDVVPRYLLTGDYNAEPSRRTLSNAMDVGDPSNLARICELFGNDIGRIRENMAAVSISDEETAATIKKVHEVCGYTMDPHTAVAYRALTRSHTRARDEVGVVLSTAHPVKFDSVADILGNNISVPESVAKLEMLERRAVEITSSYEEMVEMIKESL